MPHLIYLRVVGMVRQGRRTRIYSVKTSVEGDLEGRRLIRVFVSRETLLPLALDSTNGDTYVGCQSTPPQTELESLLKCEWGEIDH